ncbi:TIM-barrel domain-containing protein [Palleronia sp. LCG004]|uniref:glycoside hydrolase family 31 protein n=1 Tax=Palleronia sp. LCG004 TaxID=3079304 RepID=UPI00294270B6|nr:TIM-barrel domain-containing protein [Palleronia sp. LCG004]WOI56560.1 glycoside hydrolase family 31 protein [Palleronia sp. LCG004]
MKTLKDWTLADRRTDGVDLTVSGRHLMRIRVLEDDLIRVSLLKDGAWRLGRTWTVAPGGDAPLEGRDRDSLSGFNCPEPRITDDDTLVIETATLRLTISHPLHLSWAARIDDEWRTFVEERRTGGTMFGVRDHRHAHFLLRHPDEPVHGLGEKTGDLDRRGRRFEMRNLDAMGYDSETTDPLYKHVPFTITQTAGAGAWSIFYDNLAPCWFDLGNELDNYHPAFRAYRAEDGDLDYYVSWAPRMLDLVKRQVRLTGGTAFPPRWTLGYSGSTMSYTDAPDAQAQLEGFLDRLAEHDLPCDSFQMSSGYTSIGTKRYVFNWNHDKVPDPDAMATKFRDAGVHLIANIKPCLLKDHPRYDEAADAGLFVRDSETPDAPEISSFWDDEGSHLDFTNPDAFDWWKDGVTAQLLEHGIGSTWNDNNEYEIWDREARCAGFGEPIDIDLMRPVMPMLMCRASEAAQRAHAPGERPYLISRSGAPGLQRHAQTWSGDNRTAWKTLRYNIRTGLGMSLSGFYNIGHDVGGFSGPRPGPELFLRWVQNGIFHPRFTIHSWNDDATVNEPWMYPEILPQIRAALGLRYRLLPYLYTQLWRAVTEDEPMLRPVFLDHPDDPEAWKEHDEFLLGPDLLVANVIDEGATERRVRLPRNAHGWADFQTGATHAPGAIVTLPVDLDTIPLFVRRGAVLPLSTGAMRAAPEAETAREFHLFPPDEGTGEGFAYDDDGRSEGGPHRVTRIAMTASRDGIDLTIAHEGDESQGPARARIVLPEGEMRTLRLAGRIITPGEEITL